MGTMEIKQVPFEGKALQPGGMRHDQYSFLTHVDFSICAIAAKSPYRVCPWE